MYNEFVVDELESIKEDLVVETAKVRDLDAGKRKVEIEYEAVSAILEVSYVSTRIINCKYFQLLGFWQLLYH